ncbi:MAG TPA: SpoIID/LytB domain-containing protein [Pyrinomonadaceae bacterium]|nr:SpoIID/LytB domain-containing protein [Pyrinomonadaceae bacterium]
MSTKLLALFIAQTLLVSVVLPRAQDTPPHTRPRRASAPAQTDAQTETLPADEGEAQAPRITAEPIVRIGLTTQARSVTISTDGRLLNASEENATPTAFEVARVRIEPRTLPPVVPPSNEENPETEIAGAPTQAGPTVDTPTKRPQAIRVAPPRDARSSIRLTSRAGDASRGAVVYASGAKRLLDARTPILFASDDESQYPVRFNEKPYRGRLEVFANLSGTLTVVNVLGLEDYVRGVVPNELSPGGYPALEALKAQAVAARTYAVSNRGRFESEGFDLLPTTRSQVYGGRSTEHPLTDRAVAETRGRVATYKGQPINALYTSTCGGRTENAENIFGGAAVPYLRGRECALESKDAFSAYTLRSSRDLPDIRDAAHATSAREVALLAAHNFRFPARIDDGWLDAALTQDEARSMLAQVAYLARQTVAPVSNDATRPPAFISALAAALDGESRADVLLNKADVEYLLDFRDADEVPPASRADVAIFLRDGHVSLYPDATLRPRQPLTRGRALHILAHVSESRALVRLQKATARPAAGGALVLRPAGKGADRALSVSANAYLFRAFGENIYQVREVNLVGGEAVAFHTDARGEVDYLEVSPAPGGAASDHSSPFTNWTETLTPSGVMSRLARSAANIGVLLDLRVRARGSSRRVLDLEVVGASGTAHIRGGRIRSALGLREQLFVIDRNYDETGRITSFVFTGRGWGHGVGMCQVGAYGLARAGLTYDKILKSYYTGINLSKLY